MSGAVTPLLRGKKKGSLRVEKALQKAPKCIKELLVHVALNVMVVTAVAVECCLVKCLLC